MHSYRNKGGLSIVRSGCDELLKDTEFWILAGLTDRSIETGGSKYFRPAVRRYELGGFSKARIDHVACGVNRNLCRILEEKNEHCGEFRANRGENGRRPDIAFNRRDSGGKVCIEVKVIFGLTSPVFYGGKGGNGVADDADKLRAWHSEVEGEAFQLVFFLQLPNYDCPSGKSWEERWTWYPARRKFLGWRRISEQYKAVVGELGKPTFRSWGAKPTPLPLPPAATLRKIERWCETAFRPYEPWKFNATDQLRDAAVGYAIWKY